MLAKSLYDERVALLSSLLFATSPIIVSFSRIVMTEMPALALIIVSAYFFFRFCESGETKHRIAFILSFTLACYAKQLAFFMLPVFVMYLAMNKGARNLVEKQTILTLLAIGILLAPLVAMTLHFSPSNVGFVADQPLSRKLDPTKLLFYVQTVWRHQLSPLAVGLGFLSITVALVRRDARSSFFLLWIIALYGMLICLGLRLPRLAIYGVPAFCLFTALSVEALRSRAWRLVLTGVVVAAVGHQFVTGYMAEPEYAGGYEEAAAYVAEHWKGSTMMLSSVVDTGYFVFFVRKMDPSRQMIVLRADKVLATSKLGRIVEERISDPSDIYQILRDFGICYVVLEDTPSESRALEWLREELGAETFVSRHKIPIRSNVRRLQAVALEIYEYKDCGPGNPDAVLDMNLPLIGDSIQVRLRDITGDSRP
jgi:hypothetical protein